MYRLRGIWQLVGITCQESTGFSMTVYGWRVLSGSPAIFGGLGVLESRVSGEWLGDSLLIHLNK